VIRVGNAPVSYGAYELTVGVLPNVPGPDVVLDAIAAAGYEGTELGPLGYLGDARSLRERLDARGLDLSGAFVQLAFAEPDLDLAPLEATLDVLTPGARPVFCDASQRPLATEGWRRLGDSVSRAADLARSRGFQPTFHHHADTSVESPSEIGRLLERTDVGLLLDTGHLAVAGGDPVRAVRDWRDRIDYVHLKDVRLDVLRAAPDFAEASRRGLFCELGAGDVDLDGFFAALDGYSGWLVVEQDWIPSQGEDPAGAIEAQARNRRWLREHAGL
jgi:inosose dehydratase